LHLLRLSPSNFAINPWSDKVEVPFDLQGAMIFSLMGAHVHAGLLHASTNACWRMETAMVGTLFDLTLFENLV